MQHQEQTASKLQIKNFRCCVLKNSFAIQKVPSRRGHQFIAVSEIVICLTLYFASRKWRSGLIRICHPDGVKFSVELNCAPKQNTRFSSSLQIHTTLSGIWTQDAHFISYNQNHKTMCTFLRSGSCIFTRFKTHVFFFSSVSLF